MEIYWQCIELFLQGAQSLGELTIDSCMNSRDEREHLFKAESYGHSPRLQIQGRKALDFLHAIQWLILLVSTKVLFKLDSKYIMDSIKIVKEDQTNYI